MPDTVNCPACGAANRAGSEWCGQCFASFAASSSPVAPVDPPAPRAVEPHPGPAAPAPAAPGPKGPQGPAVPKAAIAQPGPGSAPSMPDAPPLETGPGWTCGSCGTSNAVSADICSACNTSIYETFGAGEDSIPEVDPRTAAFWGLLPGGGHFKVGQAGLGLAVTGLLLSALVFGILMLGGSRRVFGVVLLLFCFIAWAVSIYDVTRFAAGNEDAVLLRPRVITSAMGLLFAAVIVAAVSITGEGTTP